MTDTTDDTETRMTRRDALKGGSAAAVAAGSLLLQKQLVQRAAAQTTEPRIQLGSDWTIDDDPDGNGDLVITHTPSSAEFRYDQSENQFTVTNLNVSADARIGNRGGTAVATSNQSIPDSTPTKAALDTIDNDDGNNFDLANNRYVVPEDGKYILSCQGTFSGDSGWSDGDRITAQIRVNGTITTDAYDRKIGTDFQSAQALPLKVNLTTGDNVELWVYQTSGAAKDLFGVAGGSYVTYLSVARIG